MTSHLCLSVADGPDKVPHKGGGANGPPNLKLARQDRNASKSEGPAEHFLDKLPAMVGAFWLLASAATDAFAQSDTATIAGVPGSCRGKLQLGAATLPCTGTGIVYMALPNGRVLLTFGSATPEGSAAVVTFVGEHDRQVRPEDYVLYLSRVRYGAGSVERAWDVSGECKVTMNVAGTLWSEILCDATDADRRRYTVDFRGNGKTVNVSHGAPP